MKSLLFVGCLLHMMAAAQKVQVIVPVAPVVKGTAFQVQYVLTRPEDFITAATPLFDSCQIVSGPNYYKGMAVVDGKNQLIQNIAYTLVANGTGVLRIGSLKARYKNGELTSDVAAVQAIDAPKASYKASSNYTDAALYAPGGASDERIADNLFVRTIVSKKLCYVGEAIVATFKLYSRLQSASEALNAPSFYGFSVADMLPINEAHSGIEVMNGKVYNTAILRKVQLFPVQEGNFTIDPMQIENDIEFDDSLSGRKLRVRKILSSPAVAIKVMPLPKATAEFSGAVGSFQLTALLEKSRLPLNGVGKMRVRISGAGNFIQLTEPQLAWPNGIELLNTSSKEQFNKNTEPISGSIEYLYEFTATKEGVYDLPPIHFTYFQPVQKKYITVSHPSVQLRVEQAIATKANPQNQKPLQHNNGFVWLLATVLTVLVALVILFFYRKKQKTQGAVTTVPKPQVQPNWVASIQSIDSGLEEKQACRRLQNILTNYLQQNRQILTVNDREALQQLLATCNEVVYSPAAVEGRFDQLRGQALRIVSNTA